MVHRRKRVNARKCARQFYKFNLAGISDCKSFRRFFDISVQSVSNDALTKFKGLHRVAEKLHRFDIWFDQNGTVLLNERGFSDQMRTRTDLLAGEVS